MDEATFWEQTPKSIKVYFEADRLKRLRKQQEAWLMGAYVKQALQSTILVAGLADEHTKNKMPKYPECPKSEEPERELTEKQKEMMRRNVISWFEAHSVKTI